MNKFTNIELGYSVMNATSSMPFAKGTGHYRCSCRYVQKTGSWFYAMLKFTPDFFYAKPVAIKQSQDRF